MAISMSYVTLASLHVDIVLWDTLVPSSKCALSFTNSEVYGNKSAFVRTVYREVKQTALYDQQKTNVVQIYRKACFV